MLTAREVLESLDRLIEGEHAVDERFELLGFDEADQVVEHLLRADVDASAEKKHKASR